MLDTLRLTNGVLMNWQHVDHLLPSATLDGGYDVIDTKDRKVGEVHADDVHLGVFLPSVGWAVVYYTGPESPEFGMSNIRQVVMWQLKRLEPWTVVPVIIEGEPTSDTYVVINPHGGVFIPANGTFHGSLGSAEALLRSEWEAVHP